MFSNTFAQNLLKLSQQLLQFSFVLFPFCFLSTEVHAEALKTKSLYFFDDVLKVDITSELTSKTGSFVLNIIDPSTNQPWTDLTAKHFEGSLEMTDMDMGEIIAKVTDVKPGVIRMETKFSMKGSWRLNITVKPTGTDPETKSIDFHIK